MTEKLTLWVLKYPPGSCGNFSRSNRWLSKWQETQSCLSGPFNLTLTDKRCLVAVEVKLISHKLPRNQRPLSKLKDGSSIIRNHWLHKNYTQELTKEREKKKTQQMCLLKTAFASYLHIYLAIETNSWKDSQVSWGAGAETVTAQMHWKIDHEKRKQGHLYIKIMMEETVKAT